MPIPFAFRAAARRARVAAAALALAAPAALAAQAPYSSLTFFGDSYVDTGNAFILTGGAQPLPPYFQGRFSNGLVFTDYLAQSLGRPTDAAPVFVQRAASGNYAVGGARTDSPNVGTASQIGSYLTRPGVTPATRTDATGLYVLFAGGNDLRDAGGLADPVARQAAAAAAAQRVIAQAGQLGAAGARNVLLFTLPSLGSTPEARVIPGRPAILDALATTFNSTLAAGILGLQTQLPGSTFLNFRLDNLYANILADAATGGGVYGLTNVDTPCFQAGAPSCSVSVFADALHPTTRVHQLIGQAAATYVTTGQNVALVPEPTTVLLFGAGAVALGVAARRRRAA
jgi:outer membrane lipase/esterase